MVVNTAIIVKEISLESFQMLTGNNDNYSLGYADAQEGLKDFLWFINPFTLLDVLLSPGYYVINLILDAIFGKRNLNLRH